MDIAAMLTNLGLGRESIYSSGKVMWDSITASQVTPKMIRLVVLKWKDNISPLHLTSREERERELENKCGCSDEAIILRDKVMWDS